MSAGRSTRADDEMHLDWLHLSGARMPSGDIARRYGTTAEYVRAARNRIINADMAESGEAPEAVLQGYPWRMGV